MLQTGHYSAQKRIIKKLCDFISEPILDVACGTGIILVQLSKTKNKIFGNDFSKEMIVVAKQKSPQITFTTDNAETLIHHNKKYNTIICCNLLFYLKNRNKAIKRWKELLKNTGKIIVMEEYPFIFPRKELKGLAKILKPLRSEEIIKLFRNNNMELVKKIKTKIDNRHKLYACVFA